MCRSTSSRPPQLVDEEWLELVGTSGWTVFMKDTRIRYNPAERSAAIRHSVQCFFLTSPSLSSSEMALRFLSPKRCGDSG